MVLRYPGLVVNNRVFYLRVRVPSRLCDTARCTEISYSLNTSNYRRAVQRWKTELAHLQTFMNVFEGVMMKITEDKKLLLNETDIDKILLYRLDQIQHFLEENVTDIEQGKKSAQDIQLYRPDVTSSDKVQELMVQMVVDYFKKLIESNQANVTLRTTYSKLRNKEIELGLAVKNQDDDEWFKSFSTHAKALEKYASNATQAILDRRFYTPSNPKIQTLLATYDIIKTNERINKITTTTTWQKFFKRFAVMKKNLKSTTDARIHENFIAIELCFGLMELEYVESITKQDCRRLCERIYQVPKRWTQKISDWREIPEILSKNDNNVLGKKTIKEYLVTFKEFLRYAAKEELLVSNFNDFIDMPIKTQPLVREAFTMQELHKIFDPKTYPSPQYRKNMARFWVPLIALYQGCRLNEICQLDVDDVVKTKNIPCLNINHNAKDKSTKNESSVRIVPIHRQLLKMGFLSYVEFQRKQKKAKLFSDLKQQKRGLYGRAVQAWFANYLDKLGVDEPSKVFHSFRHTFETRAVDAKIPTEYQNALGGWTDYGIGQRVYAKKKDIRILKSELDKISYPLLKELKEMEKAIKDSFWYRKD